MELILIGVAIIVVLLIIVCIYLRRIFLELEWIRLSDPVGKELFEEAVSLTREDLVKIRQEIEKKHKI